MSEEEPQAKRELSKSGVEGKTLSEEQLRAALRRGTFSEEELEAVQREWQRLANSNTPAGWIARMPPLPQIPDAAGRWQRRLLVLKYHLQRQ